MKQLEISSGGKYFLGLSCQSSRCATNDPNYSLPTSSPVKLYLRARKLQRKQIKKSPFSQDCEDWKASLKLLKKKNTGNLCSVCFVVKWLQKLEESKQRSAKQIQNKALQQLTARLTPKVGGPLDKTCIHLICMFACSIRLEQGNVTSLLEEKGTVSLCLAYSCNGFWRVVLFQNVDQTFQDKLSGTEVRCLVDVPRQKLPSVATGDMANYLKNKAARQIPDKFLRNLHDASALYRYLESFYTLRKPVASTINTLAGALYKVFCASPDQAMKEMRQACFEYLNLGEVFLQLDCFRVYPTSFSPL